MDMSSETVAVTTPIRGARHVRQVLERLAALGLVDPFL